jgi:alpha-beta hydrolase superfamily lysophospholipase
MRPLAAAAVTLLLQLSCAPVETPGGPEVAAPRLGEQALTAPDGTRLPMRAWLPEDDPPDAVVIALHGFNDYSSFFDGPGRFLAGRGVASYAYDQRGFGASPNRGLWPGTAALVSDARAAITAVRVRHPGTPLYLFGESMGAAVAMTLMADPAPPDIDGIVLSAPAVWGRSSMPWYQTAALWMAVRTFPGRRLTGGGLGITASDNMDMLMALGRDPLVIKATRIDAVWGLVNLMDEAMATAPAVNAPRLILYGEHDQIIPPDAVGELLARLPGDGARRQRFALYPHGWHMLTRDLQAEVVWRDIAAWIADPASPLPSGADASGAAISCPGSTLCVIGAPSRS